ncbi:DUF4396 domain-containing protein [Altericroceibacterium endophyticum]|uniref:DUF4396 domain-containing protein n=1 Tax=Altericroceibacterium endophyticum TaxID=1808508 RepID=A0A6I4TBA5_9SPHN|nr:DUF4396 domain-containing protein [Altericroceibacterium endophyticum]MXO67015.1 DUF4396 domain-containing protein [Altericroceibacterium endophyticum]
MIPQTLEVAAIAFLLMGVLCALYVALQMVRHPPQMAVMRLVWPLCALFAGPVLIWFYHRYSGPDADDVPFAAKVAKGTLHCGAGCSLADLLCENLAHYVPGVLAFFGMGTLFSTEIYAQWTMDFVFALLTGIVFQYFAIVPMRELSFGEGIWAAAKADVLSLTSWQVGMYGFMGISHFLVFPLSFGAPIDAGNPVFWVAMQIAMLAGFATAYFPNWLLIRSGVKEEM